MNKTLFDKNTKEKSRVLNNQVTLTLQTEHDMQLDKDVTISKDPSLSQDKFELRNEDENSKTD